MSGSDRSKLGGTGPTRRGDRAATSKDDIAAGPASGGASDGPAKRAGGVVAAFFDVDGTLLSCQSGTLYIGYLRRQGLMDRSDQLRIYWSYLTYRLGVLNMRRLADVLSRWLRDREEREIADHCRHWYDSEVSRYYRHFVVDKVREHQAAGHVVSLLTGGTPYLNNLIAAELGVEHVLASRLEVVDGRFTGNPLGPICYGRAKIGYAEAFAETQGIALELSYFYSDSITDLPMLERVGHPVVVCPDPRLRREARRRGWPIIEATTAEARPRSEPAARLDAAGATRR